MTGNPHKDRDIDVRHSQLKLLFCMWARNPHEDRGIDVRHSRAKLLFLLLVCNPHEDPGIDVHPSQLKLLFIVAGVQPSRGSWHRSSPLPTRIAILHPDIFRLPNLASKNATPHEHRSFQVRHSQLELPLSGLARNRCSPLSAIIHIFYSGVLHSQLELRFLAAIWFGRQAWLLKM